MTISVSSGTCNDILQISIDGSYCYLEFEYSATSSTLVRIGKLEISFGK